MAFAKAVRTKAKARIALHGPSGSGKTMSALKIAHGLGSKIALLDTESGSASKYADTPEIPFPFDVDEAAPPYCTARVLEAIHNAVDAGYDVLILDSLTHFWKGEGGILGAVDDAAARMRRPDSHAAWKEGDRLYREMVDAMLRAPIHIIATMRAKQAYEKSTDANGKTKIEKLGMEPEMRGGAEYEFDVEGMLDMDNVLRIGKTRVSELKGATVRLPGEKLGAAILAWCETGAARRDPPATAPAAPSPPPSEPVQTPAPTTTATAPVEAPKHHAAVDPDAAKAAFREAKTLEQLARLEAGLKGRDILGGSEDAADVYACLERRRSELTPAAPPPAAPAQGPSIDEIEASLRNAESLAHLHAATMAVTAMRLPPGRDRDRLSAAYRARKAELDAKLNGTSTGAAA